MKFFMSKNFRSPSTEIESKCNVGTSRDIGSGNPRYTVDGSVLPFLNKEEEEKFFELLVKYEEKNFIF